MTEAITLKTSFEELSRKIRDTVRETESFSVHQPETVVGVYEMIIQTETFLRQSSSPLYEEIYQVSNLLEDHIRSVYLFMDDATLDGHATELENHLAQLRMCEEDIRSAAKTFNDEAGGIFTTYMSNLKTTLESEKMIGLGIEGIYSPVCHLPFMERVMFTNQGFHHVRETLRDYKESCIKLLSIMAMTLGRWETKLEDRVDKEHFHEGMIMSNIEAGGSISSKKNKRYQKDNLYM